MAENGGGVIDTARVYGGGRAEEVIGQVIRELDSSYPRRRQFQSV